MKKSKKNSSVIENISGCIIAIPVLVIMLYSLPFLIVSKILNLLWFRLRVKRSWYPKGKFLLYVYSNSENWKEYIEKNIIPRIKDKAVILNWSERKEWLDKANLESKIFKHFAGVNKFTWAVSKRNKTGIKGTEYNPIAILYPRKGKVRVLRFFQAFKDYKHGKDIKLKKLEKELFAFVESNKK